MRVFGIDYINISAEDLELIHFQRMRTLELRAVSFWRMV